MISHLFHFLSIHIICWLCKWRMIRIMEMRADWPFDWCVGNALCKCVWSREGEEDNSFFLSLSLSLSLSLLDSLVCECVLCGKRMLCVSGCFYRDENGELINAVKIFVLPRNAVVELNKHREHRLCVCVCVCTFFISLPSFLFFLYPFLFLIPSFLTFFFFFFFPAEIASGLIQKKWWLSQCLV